MEGLIVPTGIKELFSWTVRLTCEELGLPDDSVSDYLADLLTRFACTDELWPRNANGAPMHGLVDRLAEIQRAWEFDTPHFNPERELELRRGIGDYTLFLSGFFWESVCARSAARHYVRQGRRAYRFVAEHHRALGQPEAQIFRALALRFETYAAALSYLRDVHLGAEFAPWPHRMFAKIITR